MDCREGASGAAKEHPALIATWSGTVSLDVRLEEPREPGGHATSISPPDNHTHYAPGRASRSWRRRAGRRTPGAGAPAVGSPAPAAERAYRGAGRLAPGAGNAAVAEAGTPVRRSPPRAVVRVSGIALAGPWACRRQAGNSSGRGTPGVSSSSSDLWTLSATGGTLLRSGSSYVLTLKRRFPVSATRRATDSGRSHANRKLAAAGRRGRRRRQPGSQGCAGRCPPSAARDPRIRGAATAGDCPAGAGSSPAAGAG
mmetsp:Transcript_119106/g.273155  ORF Transcript_119106/g.273155 Transcript_119106/m.273155 type:complete len:255 (+) Transcript_119106:152-916(+)